MSKYILPKKIIDYILKLRTLIILESRNSWCIKQKQKYEWKLIHENLYSFFFFSNAQAPPSIFGRYEINGRNCKIIDNYFPDWNMDLQWDIYKCQSIQGCLYFKWGFIINNKIILDKMIYYGPKIQKTPFGIPTNYLLEKPPY